MIEIHKVPNNENILAVLINFNQITERQKVKEIKGRRWDPDKKYWTIPYTKESLKHFNALFYKQYICNFTFEKSIPDLYEATKEREGSGPLQKTKFKHQGELDQVEQELILLRYSFATIKAYKHQLFQFFLFYKTRSPDTLTQEDVRKFLLYLIKKKRIAERTQNQYINAIKFYFEKVLKRDRIFLEINRPKTPKDLPKHLSPNEVSRLLKSVKNLKHKAILMCIYAGGLRLSELINLKISDIRSDEQIIRIQCGKGKKDRTTLLSKKLLKILRAYYKQYRPKYYLFEGQHGGQYSQRSVQNIMQRGVVLSGIRHATPHTLRHSFATHLVQSGVDISHVKELLGHNSLRTTEIYLHLSQNDIKKINNPLDNLDI